MHDLTLDRIPAGGVPFARILRPIDRITDTGNVLSALCLLGIFLLVAAEILARNLLGYSISFSWDVAAYLMGGCFMFAAASALKEGAHVRVTGLVDAVRPRTARMLDLVATLVGLATAAALAWALCEMAWLSFERGSTSAAAVRIPLVWPQAALAAGAILLCLQILAQLLRVIGGGVLARGEGLE
ncbi:TRAP transporter small permease subunit [Falsirhodobacter sp. 20TX0035]|uniref:TRAP transporter small permease subunit n=1 Tax=Falsirhodobacter sp. 20TX0035 TaxID=3022019 RepID=UPI00232D25F4|nr:TRAP transporter small permease [Falsirhodobacter sp. 20TX0035]MDB6454221.1 TRAP transporter small permease [Falsirhodobacter sp. 20TX0035]